MFWTLACLADVSMEDVLSFKETEDAILHKQAIFKSQSSNKCKIVRSQKGKLRVTSVADAYFTGWYNKSGSVVEHLTNSSVCVVEQDFLLS